MPIVIYVAPDGSRSEVEAPQGTTVMQAALDNAIDGIVGECCGSMACATCHCYVDDEWLSRVADMAPGEEDILSGSPLEVTASSRLSCQLEVSAELDGLVVHVPASQY